mmetsp:Transcript_31520/g.73412  ORF Transcript_31520/g.73412 Transcript_31520/m.73412 type:complete len:251 (+) Transcript_31520:124-876(+)
MLFHVRARLRYWRCGSAPDQTARWPMCRSRQRPSHSFERFAASCTTAPRDRAPHRTDRSGARDSGRTCPSLSASTPGRVRDQQHHPRLPTPSDAAWPPPPRRLRPRALSASASAGKRPCCRRSCRRLDHAGARSRSRAALLSAAAAYPRVGARRSPRRLVRTGKRSARGRQCPARRVAAASRASAAGGGAAWAAAPCAQRLQCTGMAACEKCPQTRRGRTASGSGWSEARPADAESRLHPLRGGSPRNER